VHRLIELSFQHPLDKDIFPTYTNNLDKELALTPEQRYEIINQQRNLDYGLTTNLRALHLKSRKVLGEIVASLLQASLIHGLTSYDLLLKPINYQYVEGLKERGVGRDFNRPMNLEHIFNTLIEELGE
jgi:hypothetical protein